MQNLSEQIKPYTIDPEKGNSLITDQTFSSDNLPLEHFSLDDLDADSLQKLKTLTANRYPAQNMMEMSDEDFLIRIGAATRNRSNGELILKSGIILFIGKTNVIHELFPHFLLDYFEFRNESTHRWDYRISDDDYLNSEINLLTFYEKAKLRLSAIANELFSLDENMTRRSDSGLTEIALREALVNTLVHADYQMNDAAVKIEANPNRFVFSNPGKMLIDPQEYFTGGTSIPRNELLMRLFRNIGAAERQGFGGCQIYESSLKRDWKQPLLQTSLMRTTLTIWTEGIIDIDPNLTEQEKTILYIISSEKGIYSFSDLKNKTKLSEYYLRKSLKSLVEKVLCKKTV